MLNIKRPDGLQLHQSKCTLRLVSMVNATKINTLVTATLTENHLILEPPQSHTYLVVGKGDRLFHNLVVPLKRTTNGGGLQGCSLVQPWFGPNRWEGILIPSKESTFEPLHEFRISLSFKDGGAFEFVDKFNERVQKVITAQTLGVDEVLPPYEP